LYDVLFAVRTTCKLLPYAKKEAAVKKEADVLLFGLPKVLTKVISESTRILLFTGPQTKGPAIAPAVVKIEGTTVVKSTSE
jgi:CO dehydrogenase/acetyl-CoA synthase epsilon subunit